MGHHQHLTSTSLVTVRKASAIRLCSLRSSPTCSPPLCLTTSSQNPHITMKFSLLAPSILIATALAAPLQQRCDDGCRSLDLLNDLSLGETAASFPRTSSMIANPLL